MDALKCIIKSSPKVPTHRPDHIHGHGSAYQITFQHIQLAMSRRMPLRELATTEVQILSRPPLASPFETSLMSVESRIIDGCLYLRVQQWITFHDFFHAQTAEMCQSVLTSTGMSATRTLR